LSQKLYDTLTGIQTGKIEDKLGWTQEIKFENKEVKKAEKKAKTNVKAESEEKTKVEEKAVVTD
jgi:branched-chain amino acid aminotransferase